jgi:galactokinase
MRGHGWLSVSQWDFQRALPGADVVALRSVKLDQIVWARSPVRLDLAGVWTDTPPFTLREGGEVVNVAVNLHDQPPIQVFCRPTEERTIRIHSIDLGAGETIRRFDELEDFNNPGSPFALPKAALRLLGLTSEKAGGATLADELGRSGCGLDLSLCCAVPKGSGLGTSSILGATIRSTSPAPRVSSQTLSSTSSIPSYSGIPSSPPGSLFPTPASRALRRAFSKRWWTA